ncbi:beta-carotene isomerase D27, chloroplastic-like [Arachis duranensis]|uniref:Beta-carotene isomerase D27, chloroplastic-like n=1 Tax=Arachis duranensis TaxID=130453 RepID=A0A6P5N3W7_ARADU|nr:beta-carotene isomerase D27, chloroplastic-like [Arachis duranensis]
MMMAQHGNNSLTLTSPYQWMMKLKHKSKSPFVVGVLARPAENIAQETNVYKDNWFDHLAINHLSKSVQASTGHSNRKSGYESLVEAAMVAYKEFNSNEQKEVIIQALDRAFPRPILMLIRTMLPPSKFAREYFAAFTTLFFAWLVGPSEVRESEMNGRREKNVVHIKKCRGKKWGVKKRTIAVIAVKVCSIIVAAICSAFVAVVVTVGTCHHIRGYQNNKLWL